MEDTLGVLIKCMNIKKYIRLNPCFNGRYSRSHSNRGRWTSWRFSLNPCFNGRYSRRKAYYYKADVELVVLILVLMEDTLGGILAFPQIFHLCLNPCFNGRYSRRSIHLKIKHMERLSLNPCFNGRYSRSYLGNGKYTKPN